MKVVIELDGPVHETSIEYDEFRDPELEHKGIRVLRIKNEELHELDKVLKKIKDYLSNPPPSLPDTCTHP